MEKSVGGVRINTIHRCRKGERKRWATLVMPHAERCVYAFMVKKQQNRLAAPTQIRPTTAQFKHSVYAEQA